MIDYLFESEMYLDTEEELWKLLDAIAGEDGLTLYDAERHREAGVRVFVAKGDFNGGSLSGVTSDDCARFCRRLQTLFVAEGTKYGVSSVAPVEVSSPGINRALRLSRHFKSAVGERVKVTVFTGSLDAERKSKRTVIGHLLSFSCGELVVEEEEKQQKFCCKLEMVERACVDFKF